MRRNGNVYLLSDEMMRNKYDAYAPTYRKSFSDLILESLLVTKESIFLANHCGRCYSYTVHTQLDIKPLKSKLSSSMSSENTPYNRIEPDCLRSRKRIKQKRKYSKF